MLETVVLVIAGAVNSLLGLSAFLLWQAIQSVKESIQTESEARQATEQRLQGEITKIESQIGDHHQYAAETYIRRDDYREDMGEIKTMIRQILSKMDYKQDK